jgi:hypothetical protein
MDILSFSLTRGTRWSLCWINIQAVSLAKKKTRPNNTYCRRSHRSSRFWDLRQKLVTTGMMRDIFDCLDCLTRSCFQVRLRSVSVLMNSVPVHCPPCCFFHCLLYVIWWSHCLRGKKKSHCLSEVKVIVSGGKKVIAFEVIKICPSGVICAKMRHLKTLSGPNTV